MPAFHTIYRSAPGENRKGRPSFYSKDSALASFLEAVGAAPPGDRLFINDGVLPDHRSAAMQGAGEVMLLNGAGNSRSYRACVSMCESRPWNDDDVVYLSEDDYLHHPDAFSAIAEAARTLPDVDYFSAYDHPNNQKEGDRLGGSAACAVGEHVWLPVRSTCLTYAARVRALRRDSWVHYLCSRDGLGPGDNAIWLILGRAGTDFILPRLLAPLVRPRIRHLARAWARGQHLPPPAQLYAVRPALATHLEDGMLSSGRDWSELAKAARLPSAIA